MARDAYLVLGELEMDPSMSVPPRADELCSNKALGDDFVRSVWCSMGRPYQEVNLKGKGHLHVPLNFILVLYLDDIEIRSSRGAC